MSTKKALEELVSIVKIHSEATGNNFAWAEVEYAEEMLNKELRPVELMDELNCKTPDCLATYEEGEGWMCECRV